MLIVGAVVTLGLGGCGHGSEKPVDGLLEAGGSSQGGASPGGTAAGGEAPQGPQGGGGSGPCGNVPKNFCRDPDPAAGPGCCGAAAEPQCNDDGSGFECPPGTILTSECATCDQGGVSCADEGRLPPPGLTHDTTALSDVFNGTSPNTTLLWEHVFNRPFPDGGTVFLKTQRDQYISLEFTTVAGEGGTIQIVNPQGTANFGLTLLTLSECPGDFTDAVGANCKKLFLSSTMDYVVGTGGSWDCELKPDTTYYLNMLHTTDPDPPFAWECAVSPGGEPNSADPDACRDLVQVRPDTD